MEDFKKHEKNVTSYKKYEKGGIESAALEAKVPTNPAMGNLVGEIPQKIQVAGEALGKTSVKKDSANANPLHGSDGKAI